MTLTPGQTLAPKTLPPVSQQQLADYAEASGDLNPIHLSEEAARGAGLPGVIAHGMLSATWLSDYGIRTALSLEFGGGRGFRIRQFHTRFRAMTLLGDTVTLGGSIKQSSAEELHLELWAKTQSGATTLTGALTLVAGSNLPGSRV